MRRLLTILLLLIVSLAASADKWYIATVGNGGSDTDGDGSITYPWLTLKHAADTISGANFIGDTIMVGVGTFTEPDRINLNVGVSIYGAGATSVIVSTYIPTQSYDASILLESISEGTDGAQSISHITLDGSSQTAQMAIMVFYRNNVKIHDCIITDFDESGVCFWGTSVYHTGNEIYNCNIDNCSTRKGTLSNGLIRIKYQDGILIHDNTLTQNTRAQGYNGNIVDAVGGYFKNLKYYNNKSYKPTDEGVAGNWNMHLEFWDQKGGCEFYDNEFWGGGVGIDVGGYVNSKGTSTYSCWIHDNLFAIDSPISWQDDGEQPSMGITMEGTCEDIIINNNHFRNYPFGVSNVISGDNTGTFRHHKNIWVYYNLFESSGYTNTGYSYACMLSTAVDSTYFQDFYYYNNVIAGNVTEAGFRINSNDTIKRIYIRNNIVTGIDTYGWLEFYDGAGIIDSIFADYNILDDNVANSDVYFYNGKSVTHLDTLTNTRANPYFVNPTDFHLQAGSPAIDIGMNVGLTEDYEGNVVPYNKTPDIGAYEYDSHKGVAGGAVLGTGTGSNFMVDKNGRIIIIQ